MVKMIMLKNTNHRKKGEIIEVIQIVAENLKKQGFAKEIKEEK